MRIETRYYFCSEVDSVTQYLISCCFYSQFRIFFTSCSFVHTFLVRLAEFLFCNHIQMLTSIAHYKSTNLNFFRRIANHLQLLAIYPDFKLVLNHPLTYSAYINYLFKIISFWRSLLTRTQIINAQL